MEKEGDKGEANNFAVSFSALHKGVANVLDIMERLKNEKDQIAVDMADHIEKLKFVLAFICTYVQLSYSDLEEFEHIMTDKRQEVENLLQLILDDVGKNVGCKSMLLGLFKNVIRCGNKVKCKYNMHHVLPSLNIDDCINLCHRSKSSATMTDEQWHFVLLNLHHLSKYCAEQAPPAVTEYEILQNVCGNLKDFHGLIVNGYVEHEIAEYVLPQFQPSAEKVGLFLWDEAISKDSQVFKLPHLFLKIIPIQLEVMHICLTNLKASTSAEVGHFIKQLLETSPHILREYLIHLQQHMVTALTPSTSGARNIHVMIEFLLVILTDVPKDFIHHDKFFDLLERVGVLTRKVSTLVCGLEEKSMKKESTNDTNCTTLDLLKDIELLKGDLRHVYLKALDSSQICFPMSDGQLFMHLLLIHLNDLLDSNAHSIALIKEEIRVVKEDLEFIRSFFANTDQELCKDLWTSVLDVAYESKDVIDSIIVRYNGLVHLIFSFSITIKKIKVIKEDVSNLPEKIPRNSGLIVVNSPKKTVESKSHTADKIFVGFEEETHWIIRKLTSGPADLDVISIAGMLGLGKTTLAYKVYNDKSVSSHFDLRAWCTVDQANDKKE